MLKSRKQAPSNASSASSKEVHTTNKDRFTSDERRLLAFAATVRLAIWVWGIVANALIEDYDTSDRVWKSLSFNNNTTDSSYGAYFSTPSTIKTDNSYDSLARALFNMFAHWDAVFFTRIAEVGYEFEHYHAFFPLLPALMRLVASTALRPLVPFFGFRNTLIVSGFLISNVCFVLSVVVFYRLTMLVIKNREFAFKSALLYSINPASVFMSAVYTESLFALTSLTGMYMHFSGYSWIAAICFALSSATRSNGTLLAGFFIYSFLHNAADIIKRARAKGAITTVMRLGSMVAGVLGRTLITFMPLILFQYYSYRRYCFNGDVDFIRERHPWCLQRIPLLYDYVQHRYWNVGFMNYYEVKQIPNFLLASPFIILSVCGIASYVRRNPTQALSIGFVQSKKKSTTTTGTTSEEGFHKPALDVLVFIYYWMFTLLVGLTVMHVQVITRFHASCPPFYWFCTHLLASEPALSDRKTATRTRSPFTYVILGYFLSFIVVGVMLFCNFYPWT